MNNPYSWFQEHGLLVGFALLFPLDLIVLGLYVLVLSCVPREPSVAGRVGKYGSNTVETILTQQRYKKQLYKGKN